MKRELSYGRLQINQRPTTGGRVAVDVTIFPQRIMAKIFTARVYRDRPLDEGQLPAWSMRQGARFVTYAIGLDLVASFRLAIAEGLIKKEDATRIRGEVDGSVYTSRTVQDHHARRLFDMTGLSEHYMTDAWLVR